MQRLIHEEIVQRSGEWYSIRTGKITASSASILMAVSGLGKTAETYAMNLVSSDFYFESEEPYISKAMQNGIDLEPFAIAHYEQETFQTVYQVGFISLGDKLGCSPDGLIGEDGGLEVKCPQRSQHFENVLSDECPKIYYDQVQFSLYVSGRKWWDVVSYNPNFAGHHQYKSWRVEPDTKWITAFEKRLLDFEVVENKIRTKLASKLIINNN